MKTLIRAFVMVFLLSGVAGAAAAQRGWVDIELGRRPSVRGHVVLGGHRHHRYHRPYVHRHYHRPVIVVPRMYHRRPVVVHRLHRAHRHYRWF